MKLTDRDQQMLVRAQTLLEQVRDPNLLGELDNIKRGAIGVWDWAEATGRVALQAEIAHVTSWQIHVGRNEKRIAKWGAKIQSLAAQAKTDGRWKDYVGFLEVLCSFETDKVKRHAMTKKICEIYAQLGEREREAWYMNYVAGNYIRSGKLEEAKKLLLDSYQISQDANYQKGIGMSLLSMADFLEHQGQYADACCFLYRAKLLFVEVYSNFGITAKDILRRIVSKHSVSRNQYLSPGLPDDLVSEFRNINLAP